MAISRINFTAEPNLLTKMQNKTATQPVTAQANETPAAEEVQKSNKVRNWSIGMGSAAVLIGLGVLGHNGKLGKTLQKICGGKEKSLDEIVDEQMADLRRRADRIADEVLEELERRAGSTADDIAEAVKSKLPKIAKTAEDVTPEYIAKVNAALDRTLPNLDDVPVKIEIPEINPALKKELESIDISKIEGGFGTVKLPNGNKRNILVQDGKISSLYEYSPDGKNILNAFYYSNGRLDYVKQGNVEHSFLQNGELESFKIVSDNQQFKYTHDGLLEKIHEETRIINVKDGTRDIQTIHYFDDTALIKAEDFIDGKLAVERFRGENGNTLKEIRHDLSN